jgi:hypothetical protein
MSVKELLVMPRVGESVYLPHFTEQSKCTFYYVKKVSHRFYNGTQSVEIELDESIYNLLWHFRSDEAFLNGEIDPYDRFDFSEAELKEKLGFILRWKRMPY